MKNSQPCLRKSCIVFLLVVSAVLFSGCLTPKRIDKFIAKQYDNTLPSSKTNNTIKVGNTVPDNVTGISVTHSKTTNMLPLLFYWKFNYINTSNLNPAIALAGFTNSVSGNGALQQKLKGGSLQLTVEQIPNTFSINDKAQVVWLIYAFGWDKITIEPDKKDLVVSYKFIAAGGELKEGKITIANTDENSKLRYLEPWKKAMGEYIDTYNENITKMSKQFADKLVAEL